MAFIAVLDIDDGRFPVYQIGRFHEHHRAVGIPAFARCHVGYDHIETLVVVATHDMRATDAAGRADFRRLDHRQIVVECLEIESVVAYGIAYLLFVDAVAVEVCEQVTVKFVGVGSGGRGGTSTQSESCEGEDEDVFYVHMVIC